MTAWTDARLLTQDGQVCGLGDFAEGDAQLVEVRHSQNGKPTWAFQARLSTQQLATVASLLADRPTEKLTLKIKLPARYLPYREAQLHLALPTVAGDQLRLVDPDNTNYQTWMWKPEGPSTSGAATIGFGDVQPPTGTFEHPVARTLRHELPSSVSTRAAWLPQEMCATVYVTNFGTPAVELASLGTKARPDPSGDDYGVKFTVVAVRPNGERYGNLEPKRFGDLSEVIGNKLRGVEFELHVHLADGTRRMWRLPPPPPNSAQEYLCVFEAPQPVEG